MRRRLAAVGLAAAGVVVAPATALADPAGPTDYRSQIVAVTPPTTGVDVEIAGGDSFVLVTVDEGIDLVVMGYNAEPYLWIDATGAVFENRRSPATYVNQERYGTDVPAIADATAPPDWTLVGDGGTWAWHDHRAHRMDQFAPLNASRGDEVLDAVVPLVVDGAPVEVSITSTWMLEPSRIPMLLGFLAGAGIVLAGLLVRRPWFGVGPALAVVSAAASVVGVVQFRSLPPSTEPTFTWWLMPVAALAFAVAATVLAGRSAAGRVYAPAAAAIAALQLVLWGWGRRDGLTSAILPTSMPFWVDRFVTAVALAAGAIASVGTVVALLRAPRQDAGVTTSAPEPA